jgi:hypothetical protein
MGKGEEGVSDEGSPSSGALDEVASHSVGLRLATSFLINDFWSYEGVPYITNGRGRGGLSPPLM